MTDKVYIESPTPASAPARGWYRLESRERIKTRPEIEIGTDVQFSRYIARCGYELQPNDASNDELNERAIALVQERCKAAGHELSADAIRQVIGALHWFPMSDERDRVRLRLSLKEYPFDESRLHKPLKWVYWVARRRWFDQQRGTSNLRTFWYNDLETPILGKIVERPMRQIGHYHHGSYDSYYQEYDPAFLNVITYQQVYKVRAAYYCDARTLLFRTGLSNRFFLVHPLDATRERGQ